jgi:hypothetical protein
MGGSLVNSDLVVIAQLVVQLIGALCWPETLLLI